MTADAPVVDVNALRCPGCGAWCFYTKRPEPPHFQGHVQCDRCVRQWVVVMPRIEAQEIQPLKAGA